MYYLYYDAFFAVFFLPKNLPTENIIVKQIHFPIHLTHKMYKYTSDLYDSINYTLTCGSVVDPSVIIYLTMDPSACPEIKAVPLVLNEK